MGGAAQRKPHQLSWRPPFCGVTRISPTVRPLGTKSSHYRALYGATQDRFRPQETPRGRPAETFLPFHDFLGTGKPPKRAAGLDRLDRNMPATRSMAMMTTRPGQLILYP